MASLKDKAIQTALEGNWEEAVTLNKTLLRENPSDIDALNRMAFALRSLGKTKDAKNTYRKVLGLDSLNPLALRNLKQIESSFKNIKTEVLPTKMHNDFIEETGKTKIVELVNIAQPEVINTLGTGQLLTLSVKRFKIFILTGSKQYIGMLPDNIGKRLIKFIRAGNEYQVYIKSASIHHIAIFIKEVMRVPQFKNQASFSTANDRGLEFEKKQILKNGPQSDSLGKNSEKGGYNHELEEELETGEETD